MLIFKAKLAEAASLARPNLTLPSFKRAGPCSAGQNKTPCCRQAPCCCAWLASKKIRLQSNSARRALKWRENQAFKIGAEYGLILLMGLAALGFHRRAGQARRYDAPDLRTAAFLLAIDKVARVYQALGIFP